MIKKITQEEWEKSQKHELGYWKDACGKDIFSKRTYFGKNAEFYKRYMEDTRSKIVVDIGSGPQGGILKLLECKVAIAIDALMEDFETAGWQNTDNSIIPMKSCAENISLISNYADYVCCMNALDHMQDSEASFKEMVRILKTNGRLFINVNLRPEGSQDQYHKICIDEKFMIRIAEESNLKVLYHNVSDDKYSKRGLKTFIGIFEKEER